MARVVVVGAGIAGLAVATRLADFGHEVTVLEQRAVAGGQIGTQNVDGLVADIGPTAFTLPAVFRDLFRKTGRPLEREVELVPLDPSVRYVFPDGSHLDMPNASRALCTKTLDKALGAGAGAQWNELIQEGERMWQLLRPRLIDRHPSRHDVTWLKIHPQARRILRSGMSLTDLGTQYLHHPHLRLILDTYATSFGAKPSRAPAALAILAYLEHTFGTWGVRGGLGNLVGALERRCVERGGAIRLDCQVARVESRGHRVVGVALADGETIPADIVVSTAPPGGLDLGRILNRRWSETPREGNSVFTIAASLDARPPIPERTILLTEDGPNLTLTHDGESVPDRPAALVMHADCPAHGDAPAETDWASADNRDTYAKQVLGLAAARGVDVKQQIRSMQVRTPYDLEREFGATGGRIYGMPWHGRGALRRRLPNRSSIRGLYFAGAGAHPGPGLPTVAVSATIVADLIGRA